MLVSVILLKMSSGGKNSKRNLSSDTSFEKAEMMKTGVKTDQKRTKTNQGQDVDKLQTTIRFSQDSIQQSTVRSSQDPDMKYFIEQLTTISQKLITKDELKQQLDENKQQIIQHMTETIEKLESRVLTLEIENDTLKKQLQKVKSTSKQSESLANLAIYKNGLTMRKLNELEQHSRKDNVRMFGVSDPNKLETAENTANVVVKVLRGIDVAIDKNDIHIAHRLGPYAGNKKRPIIVKFKYRVHKNQALYNRRKLKGSGIGISEDLTTINRDYLTKLQHSDVESAWTRDTRFFVKLRNGGQVKKVDPFDFLGGKSDFYSETDTDAENE